jgi:hypothetical protein
MVIRIDEQALVLNASIYSVYEASNKDGIIVIYPKFRSARIGRAFQIPPLRLNSGLCDALTRACPRTPSSPAPPFLPPPRQTAWSCPLHES